MALSERKLVELQEQCPANCLMKGDGTYVPLVLISAAEQQKNALVRQLFAKAEEAHEILRELKTIATADVVAHIDLVTGPAVDEKKIAQQSNKLYSFDGTMEIEYTLNPIYRVNERIVEVQALVEKAASEVADGKQLVKAIRELSVGGRVQEEVIKWLDKSQVFAGSASWKEAMLLIKECLEEVEKRPYLRFYRHTEGKRELVLLNFSAVVID